MRAHKHAYTQKGKKKGVAVQSIDNIKPYKKQVHICSEQNNTTFSVVDKLIGQKIT